MAIGLCHAQTVIKKEPEYEFMPTNPNPQTWKIRIAGKSTDLTLTAIRRLNADTLKILNAHDTELNKLIRLVCMKRQVTKEQLLSHARPESLCVSRWCLWKLLADRLKSPVEIAKQTGFDRQSVMNGLNGLKNRMATSAKYKTELAWLENGAV